MGILVFNCPLAWVALQKERLITTRSARTASATMTMPRASSIVSSPKNENEHACRAHRAKGETFPSLGGTASAAGFPPGACAIHQQETAERGMSSPSPIRWRPNADRLSNCMDACANANCLVRLSGASSRETVCEAAWGVFTRRNASPEQRVCGQPVRPGLPTHWSRWI